MKITAKDVQYVADLANLELKPEETERMQRDLNNIRDYVAQLDQLATENVEPMAQVLGGQTIATVSAATLRADAPRPSLGAAAALANAPASGAGHFKVPKIIERG